MVDSINLLWWN